MVELTSVAPRIFARPIESFANVDSVRDASRSNGRAVGQQARTAIAEARAGGLELPRNIQGRIASSIARGIDPATVFEALRGASDEAPAPQAPAGEAPQTDEPVAAPPEESLPEAPPVIDEPVAFDPTGRFAPNSSFIEAEAEIALALLRGEPGER